MYDIGSLHEKRDISSLNPIENLYSIAERKKRDIRRNNAEELKASIEASWSSITLQQ